MPVLAIGRERDAVALRLQPEEAAVGGRPADRAGSIRGVSDRAHPGANRDAAAAARAAGRSGRIPRVPRVAPGGALGEPVDRELRQVGLAEDHGSGVAQPPDDQAVLLRRLAVGGRAVGRHLARVVDVVLDRDRHPQQRRLIAGGEPLLRAFRVGTRTLGEHDPVRVQLRLDPRDALQVELDQLGGRDIPGADHVREPGRAGEGQLVRGGGHHAHSRHPSASRTSSAARSPDRTAPSM